MVQKLSDEVGLFKIAQFAVIYESDHEVGDTCRGDAVSRNTQAGAVKATPGAGLQSIELTSTKNGRKASKNQGGNQQKPVEVRQSLARSGRSVPVESL
jgi:hypothetical protein